jgi:hypothetical protein
LLSPEELALLKSAQAAQREGRFHSLEENDMTKKFHALRNDVAQRHGFLNFVGTLPEFPPLSAEIVETLLWARKNCAHVNRLRKAQQAKSTSAAEIADGHSSEPASSTTLQDPNL